MKRVAFQRPFFSNRPVHRIEQTTFDRLVALLEANLTPGERRRLVIDGRALTPDAAVALAAGSEDPER